MNTPVAFLVFNRPEVTRQVFARIREARPSRLHVVCDGPRPHRPDDAAKVAAVRAIIDQGVDWPCEVVRDYAEENLGCRDRIATGLNRLFSEVEEAIILEDDCLPDPTFFPFCSELLSHYRDDTRVMHIGGTNITAGHVRDSNRFWVSHHVPIWGWATWRRAWRHYDFTMKTWEARQQILRSSFANSWERQFWLSDWSRIHRDIAHSTTWDIMWHYTVRAAAGLALIPTANLVENIGIGADSTHTSSEASHLRVPATPALDGPYPRRLRRSRFRDDLLTRVYARSGIGVSDTVRALLRNSLAAVRRS